MHDPLDNLDEVIRTEKYSDPLPLALPPSHVSIARWFDSIIDKGRLEPRMCTVFGEELLYLFYGGIFYRNGNHLTKNASELPVAFLFHPITLTSVNRYYPFDTGAMATGRFGDWENRLEPFKERFRANGGDYTVPCKMVHLIYGTNEKYLRGEINPECKNKQPPLQLLYDFMSQDFTPEGVDHRQYCIECQANSALSLDQQLLWIGFPDLLTKKFIKLLELIKPHVPEYYPYSSHVVINPSEIAAQLQIEAGKIVSRYKQFPKVNHVSLDF